MGKLWGLFGEKAPGWTPFSRKEWTEFVGQVHEVIESRGWAYTDRFEVAGIDLDDGRQIGLTNLARMWKSAERANRRAEIDRFLMAAVDGPMEKENLSWEQARDRLRLRLYPRDAMAAVLDVAVHRPFVDDMSFFVVFDGKNSAMTVKKEELEQWGVDEDIAFAVATENIRRFEAVDVERMAVSEGVEITVVCGDTLYSASNVVDLDRFIVPACPNGALVAIPNRAVFLPLRAENKCIDAALERLIGTSIGIYNREAGSATTHLFWWRDGKWQVVGGPDPDGAYTVEFPEELKQLLANE